MPNISVIVVSIELFECQFITVCNMFILIKCIVYDEINQYQTNYFCVSLLSLDLGHLDQ